MELAGGGSVANGATRLVYKNFALLVFHEDIVKYAVEDCIEEVCCAEVEDEDVGDCSHLVVACQHFNNLNQLSSSLFLKDCVRISLFVSLILDLLFKL